MLRIISVNDVEILTLKDQEENIISLCMFENVIYIYIFLFQNNLFSFILHLRRGSRELQCYLVAGEAESRGPEPV